MKKLLALILSLVILVIAFSGCKGENNNSKVTLKIGIPEGAVLTPYELIDKFKEENPDIILELDEAPWSDFKTKLQVQIAGGSAPDVFIMDSGYIASLGSQGAVLDLAKNIDTDLNTEEYTSALYSLADNDNHVWAVPHGLNSIALCYNEKLFDDAGLSYPNEDWTFEDMIAAAKKLTSPKNSMGVSDVYGLGVGYSITTGWLPFILACGGAPLNEARTESRFDDKETIDGLKKFASLTADEIAPPLPWLTTKGGIVNAFTSGNLAMAIVQTSSLASINANKASDFRYNVAAMPYGWDGNRYSIYVPNGWAINAKSDAKKQEAAWKWLKFYLSEESQMLLAEECKGGYPVNKAAVEYCSTIDTIPKDRDVFFKYIDECGVTLFENETYAEWNDVVTNNCKDIYNGVVSPEKAAKSIHKKITEILNK